MQDTAGREGAGPTWRVRAGLGFAFSLCHLAGQELGETRELHICLRVTRSQPTVSVCVLDCASNWK